MASESDLICAKFEESLCNAASYPKNLLRTRKLGFALQAYYDRLDQDENLNFHENAQALFIWDLRQGCNGSPSYFASTRRNI